MLHTPYNAANMIKNQYGTLLPAKNDNILDETQTISKVKIPILGNESETKEIPLVQIQPIIHARVEELLCLLKDKIIASGMSNKIDGGVVITGGMSKIIGLQKLASKIFDNVPVKVSTPINIQNGYIDFNNPSMSTIVGLLLYELDNENSFELDSNSDLHAKFAAKTVRVAEIHNNQSSSENIPHPLEEIKAISNIKDKKEKPKILNSIFGKISRWL
jgi:cell division protein FtsA